MICVFSQMILDSRDLPQMSRPRRFMVKACRGAVCEREEEGGSDLFSMGERDLCNKANR